MSIIPAILKEQRRIESFDVDVRGLLRPQILFGYLLNSAWKHTKGTSFGFRELSERNLFWVLVKIQIQINRMPRWGERITIETWGKRLVRLFALRDFAVSSDAGEKLVSATSTWMILDKNSGRPQRFGGDAENFPWLPEKNVLETSLEKVPQITNGKSVARYGVHFSDIDVNRHVNSSGYLQWILNSHPQEHLQSMDLRSIELSFLSEARADDTIEVFSEEAGEHELCSVRRAGDGKEFCRAGLNWRRKQEEKEKTGRSEDLAMK